MWITPLITKNTFFHIQKEIKVPQNHKTSFQTIPDIMKTIKLTIANPIPFILSFPLGI